MTGDDWLHWQRSPAAFSLGDFGFSPFQLLIFDPAFQRSGEQLVRGYPDIEP
jgi:hypothetical protein